MIPSKPVPSRLAVLIVVILLLAAGNGDEDARYRKIRDALNKFTIVYTQQKAYLHTDRTAYNSGDILWIKAYLVNGMNHQPDTLSTNLYVELVGPTQSRVEIKRFQMFKGFGIGDFKLSDTLAEGLYQLRAYTNWMRNFGEEFYFTKNFPLTNPAYSKRISPKQARVNQKELENRVRQAGEIDLQFMPEGGELVEGLESTIGFRAINPLGKGVEMSGDIVDEKGNRVTRFSSSYRGIGRFLLTPEPGKHYFAEVKNGNPVRVALPQALKTGLVMHAEVTPQDIRVILATNRTATNDRTANEVILVGQTGGRIYYHDILTLENGKAEASFKRTQFPSGVVHLTAFSGRGIPLAERLVFNIRNDRMKISMTATDTVTEGGVKTLVSLSVRDQVNKPLVANLSLAMTREKGPQPVVNRENIISYLLLSSELSGLIEDPYAYFEDRSPAMQQSLDNLMLTHGWRRFDWEKILAGEYPGIRHHEEHGIAVYGKITRDFFNIPLKNAKVQLSILSSFNDVFTQYTTEKGFFLFDNMVYFDTINVKIEAWRPNGRRNLIIVVPEDEMEPVSRFRGDYTLITQSDRDPKAYRSEKYAESKEAYQREQERLEEESKDQLHGLYLEPDQVLRSTDFPKGNTNVIEVIKGRVPGVNIYGDQVIIRGPNTIMGETQPLFLIDGMPTHDIEAVKAIPIEDVDRIEIIKGPGSAIYGMRGANGIIAIYTKRGHFMKRGVIEFDMLGYNTPRIFYQPRYKPADEPATTYTLCWLPVMITDGTGTARFIIDKPSIGGDYRFIVEGISYDGHVGLLDEVVNNE